MNQLFYGDNLEVLDQHFQNETVDLIYLDPPFNSDRQYNLLFRESSGAASEAQIEAFEDSWHWGPKAAEAYHRVMTGRNQPVAKSLGAMVDGLGHCDMTAYLAMMAARLIELHRILKPTGSLFLHCDPTAGPYLRVILDAVFGPTCFTNEIVWKRTSTHNSAKRFAPIHDTIQYYRKGNEYTWNGLFTDLNEGYVEKFYRFVDSEGRRYRLSDLTAAGIRKGESGQVWRGIDPGKKGRHWVAIHSTLERWDASGRLQWPLHGQMPQFKRYLDEMRGQPGSTVWTDIPVIGAHSKERLHYQTQKPLGLLERIIASASNPGDLVLDPFCGCGTAIHAANKLERKWAGIDITYLAINLIERRMRDAFPGLDMKIVGEPVDYASARNLALRDKYQFQWWALSKVDGQPVSGKKTKGADKGKDGVIPMYLGAAKGYKNAIVSVKGGENVDVVSIRDLRGVIERENSPLGVLITLNPPTKPMITEAATAGRFESEEFGRSYPRIQILTIEEYFAGKRLDLPGKVNPYAKSSVEKIHSGKLSLNI